MKKRILYLSLVDWNWIKQRPQIIAEGLAKNYEVDYLYPKYYRSRTLTFNDNNIETLNLHPRIKVPFSARSRILKRWDTIVSKLVSKMYIKHVKPDIIYVTHPDDYSRFIDQTDKFIIYDCMDNYSEFEDDLKRKKDLINAECKLCLRANCIIVSSGYLLRKIKGYVENKNVYLVRNGYSGEILPVGSTVKKSRVERLKIAYIGTIGPWFDAELLLEALEARSDIEFHIAGPIDKQLPQNDRIHYDGIISHDKLYEYVKDCDALMMPFIVNEIVEAVDPVKLYEYINFNKPIISIYYPEIDRFKDFVYFYSNVNSFITAIDNIRSNSMKYNNAQRESFLSENSWDERIRIITSIINAEE